MYDFGSRLKELRSRRGLTQEVLGRNINKSVAAISSYETNVQTPPTDVVVSIAQALNTSVAYLLDQDNDKSYSVKNLTNEQRALMDLIYAEFTNPTYQPDALSVQQIEIIRSLMVIFSRTQQELIKKTVYS